MKIAIVTGTRPEIIRLSQTIKLLKDTPGVECWWIHTFQNSDREMSRDFFKEFGLTLDQQLPMNCTGQTQEWIGVTIINMTRSFQETFKPDAVVVLGDTYSVLATSIVCTAMNIPLFHCEAGNRCWDERVPEEKNRRIIDRAATMNLVYTEHQRRNLLREGYHPSKIWKTGSPMAELLSRRTLCRARGSITPYYAVSIHRAENLAEPAWIKKLFESMRYNTECGMVVTLHPRLKNLLGGYVEKAPGNVRFMDPTGWHAWLQIQVDSECVISDSGTLHEEASILGFKAINVRNSNERPEAMEALGPVTIGTDAEKIINYIPQVRVGKAPEEYKTTDFSEQVLNCLISNA